MKFIIFILCVVLSITRLSSGPNNGNASVSANCFSYTARLNHNGQDALNIIDLDQAGAFDSIVIPIALLKEVPKARDQKSSSVNRYKKTIKEKRLALVIGNNEYTKVRKLSNPVNDAKAMKTALEACGFEVMTLENGTEKSIKEKVREFSEKLKSYDVGMFYFSGHGIEVNGFNYIVPVEISTNATALDIVEECVATDYVLSKMGEAGQINKTYIMMLDVARDNPFGKDQGINNFRELSIPPSGSFICYAASQGQTASEGEKLSPYTELFLKHMKTAGLKIEDIFKRVRIDLLEMKKNKPNLSQEPIEMNKLMYDFYFVPKKSRKSDRLIHQNTKKDRPNDNNDADSDGIADKDDQCPKLKGNAKNNGCPTQALLRYTGDNFGCTLNLKINIGNQSFVPNSNLYYFAIEEGTYDYTIIGEIRCPQGSICNIKTSGKITIKNRSILDFSWFANCGAALTNTGNY